MATIDAGNKLTSIKLIEMVHMKLMEGYRPILWPKRSKKKKPTKSGLDLYNKTWKKNRKKKKKEKRSNNPSIKFQVDARISLIRHSPFSSSSEERERESRI